MKRIAIIIPLIVFSLSMILYIIGNSPLLFTFIKNKVISTIQNQFDIPLQIGSIKGNAFYSLEITDVKIAEAVTFNKMKVSYNILKLLRKEIDIRDVDIDGLNVYVEQADTLVQKLARNMTANSKNEKTAFKINMNRFSITAGNIFTTLADTQITARITARGKLSVDKIVIDTLKLSTENSHAYIYGYIPLAGKSDLDLKYNINILAEELNFIDTKLKGTIVSSGSINGEIATPRIISNTELNITYQENSAVGSIYSEWLIPDIDSLALAAQIDFITPSTNNNKKNLEQWHLSLNAQGRKIFCDVISSHGTMKFNGTVTGDINSPIISGQFAGKLTRFSFTPNITGTITYKNNALYLSNLKIESRELTANCHASISLKEPQRVSAELYVSCRDVSFINKSIEIPEKINGKAYASAKINGTIQDPVLTGILHLEEIRAFNENITNADLNIAYRNATVTIDSGIINSTRGIIAVDGKYCIADSTFKARLQSTKITFKAPEIVDQDTILLSGSIGFEIDLSGTITNPAGDGIIHLSDIVYDTLNIGNYSIHINLMDSVAHIDLQREDTSLHLVADTRINDPFSFNAHLNLRHFNLSEYTPSEIAHITAQISAYGEFKNLKDINGRALIDTVFVSLKQNIIQNAGPIHLTVDQGLIDIDSCALAVHGQDFSMQGQIPFDFTEGGLNITIKTSEIDIVNLAALIPDAPAVTGVLLVDMNINGSLPNPMVNGKLILNNVKYSVPDLDIDSLSCLVLFNNHLMNIEYLKGKANLGNFNINGSAILSEKGVDTAFIAITLNKIDLRNEDYGSGIFSGTMNAVARNEEVRIDGEVFIDKAVYDIPFNLQTIIQLLTKVNQPPREQNDILKNIYCNLEVSSIKGIGIKNNIADFSADVDLQVKGYLSKINVYGTIASSGKGTVKYLGKKFDILNAVMQFDNPYEINPELEINASHLVNSIDGDYEIFMQLKGTISDWRLVLSSSPTVPEPDIVSLLLIGRRRPGSQIVNNVNLKGAAKDYAFGLARGTIERTAEQKLGIEKFTVTGDLLKPRHLNIGIEKKIAKKFTLIYSTDIESWELHKIGINYDLTDNLSIFTLHDQENLNSSIDFDIHFEIK